MKRLLALSLALLLCMASAAALAEAAPATDPIEVPSVENGTVVPFPDHNFQITLPSDWLVLEITTEQEQRGIIYSCVNPEGTRSFSIAFTVLDAATDLDAVASELAASYDGVQTITINDIPFVQYTVTENDVTGIATLNNAGDGFYQFLFYPTSDSDYSYLALQIAASINTIQ